MRPLLTLMFCSALLLGPAGAAGRAQKRKGPKKAPARAEGVGVPAAKAVRLGGARWSEYASDEGRFKVNFPAAPEVETNRFGTTVVTEVRATQAGAAVWRVTYADDPVYSDDEGGLREAYAGTVRALERGGRRLISSGDVRVNGKLGVEYVLEDSDSVQRTRGFMVGTRLYLVTVQVPGARASGGAHLTGEVNRFFDSFNFW